MSRKKKKIQKSKYHNHYKNKKGVQNLQEEIRNINRKLKEGEVKAYQLKSNKTRLIEDLAELFLMNSDARKILDEYVSNEVQLRDIEKANKNRKIDLESKEKKLTEEEKKTINDEFAFKKIGDADYPVGLYNQPCYEPVAICKDKNVYLSYKDVRYKRCLKHRDKKLGGCKQCKHLVWLNDDGKPIT